MNNFFLLFKVFASIGCFTFGGGYAMLPIILREVVDKHNWATKDEIMNYYAIGQCTPGIIAVNTATFIGYKQGGLLVALFATGGMVFPSIVIITIIASFIESFINLSIVSHAFAGIRVAVAVLVINAIIIMWKSSIIDMVSIIIFFVTFILTSFFNISPIRVIITAGILGIISKKMGGNKQ